MPRPARPWFRFYTEAVHDRKMRRLTPAQRWLWVAVLAAARESCQPGVLMVSESLAYTVEDLADFAGMKARDVAVGIDLLIELGSVAHRDDGAWFVTKWDVRQFESDDVTARTAKHRSKEQDRNVPTTAVGTSPETEADTETENAHKSRRKLRPPCDFQPTEEHRAFAIKEHLDLNREQAHWLEWCEANGKTYSSVNAGFSTWLRQAVQFGRGNGSSTSREQEWDFTR